MLLFRSEQDVEEWCGKRGRAVGASFPVETGWQLAVAWAEDRLNPNWTQRDRTAMTALFESLGLRGGFWALPEE